MNRKTSWRTLGLVLGLTIALAGNAAAQLGRAFLRTVESGNLEADANGRSASMCLDGGSYVLALELGDEHDTVAALVHHPENMPVALTRVDRTDENRWNWASFNTGRECFTLRVVGGRTAVYQLSVSVNW